MNDTTYNGWSNYQTWNVNLWLSNEEPLYDKVRGMAERYKDADDKDAARIGLADDLRPFVEQMVFGDEEVYGIRGDLLTHALGMVDWYEIAGTWLEE
jgi:hypothetical protein